MRRLELGNYKTPAGQDYQVRESVMELCFIPQAGCKPTELLQRQILCEKIRGAGESILLETAEWHRLMDALEAVPALGRNEVDLVQRIREAPEVNVQEK